MVSANQALADQALIGFYAINAYAVDYRDLPKRFARARPGNGTIPAAFIAMIGRDQRYSGAGFGADLLVDALRRIAQAADSLGIAVALLDLLDCGDPDRTARRQALYESYGFQPLPSSPTRLFLPLNTIRELMAGRSSRRASLQELQEASSAGWGAKQPGHPVSL